MEVYTGGTDASWSEGTGDLAILDTLVPATDLAEMFDGMVEVYDKWWMNNDRRRERMCVLSDWWHLPGGVKPG